MQILKQALFRIFRDQRGVTLVEYGIALTVALVVGTGALSSLGGAIGSALSDASVSMPN